MRQGLSIGCASSVIAVSPKQYERAKWNPEGLPLAANRTLFDGAGHIEPPGRSGRRAKRAPPRDVLRPAPLHEPFALGRPTARSSFPSPLKSATENEVGIAPPDSEGFRGLERSVSVAQNDADVSAPVI